jgi:tetratricopeptide (TPR) repeat protein
MSLADLAILDPLKRCAKAAELIYAGQYEQAKEALGGFWRSVGERPTVDHYPPETAGEILLQCGVLSSLLGNAQASLAQEKAKDMVSEARRLFQSCDNLSKISEANCELGGCYFRAGAYEEARIMYAQAFNGATPEQHCKTVIGAAIVEIFTGRYERADEILREAKPFFDDASDALKARWHGQLGLLLRRSARGRIEFLDRAIIEFTAAIYHYERAGHIRFCGRNLNNLAPILYKLGRYAEAHEQLDRAHLIFSRLRDKGNVAQVEETRARALIAEGRYVDAGRVIKGVVEILERGGESALLVDALTNKAIVQARLADHVQASQTFRHAIRLGEESGARFNAGLAAISMMEELKLRGRTLFRVYRTADECLSQTQDEEVMARLRGCARLAINQLGGPQLDKNFSLKSAMHFLEARYVEEALIKSEGRITKAASFLGVTHQALRNMLDHRHKNLLSKRLPMKKRYRSIIKKS